MIMPFLADLARLLNGSTCSATTAPAKAGQHRREQTVAAFYDRSSGELADRKRRRSDLGEGRGRQFSNLRPRRRARDSTLALNRLDLHEEGPSGSR